MAKMGRPEIQIDVAKLKAVMRLKPTLKDTAAFFECDPSTIENFIRREFNLTFSDFREQNMVHTRFSLIRKAIQKAENGDNVMLIFCLKNLCQWRDRFDEASDAQINMTSTKDEIKDLINQVTKIAKDKVGA